MASENRRYSDIAVSERAARYGYKKEAPENTGAPFIFDTVS
jgi:hypothetical protein